MRPMSAPIEDYAVIGDLHTIALVSRAGSIDWLCLPHFDSGAAFAALLGTEDNGHWTIAPTTDIDSVSRNYRPGTLVLETEMATHEGTIRITDFMPKRESTSHKKPEVIRIVEGLEGSVHVRSELKLRFDYGRGKPFVRETDFGLHAMAGPDGVLVVSPRGVEVDIDDHTVVTDLTVEPGQTYIFQILWHNSWEPVPDPSHPTAILQHTTHGWREWSETCPDFGTYQDAIVRSLITLKSLTYWPSGGVTAAATTSLPEQIGGPRNWDYRYCWLRDSAVTLEALMRCGYTLEAKAWRDWLLRAVAGDPAQMQIMYGIGGERRLEETEIDWLPGYENSTPVRIGNAASGQFQLDVYGEVADASYYSLQAGLKPGKDMGMMGQALAEFVRDHWSEPDDGIWEVRGDRKHFTHSKVMAWVALDRKARAIADYGADGDEQEWRAAADAIKEDILAHGVDPDRNCFTQSYGSKEMDAALLVIPQVDFLPPDDPRIINTVHEVQAQLMVNGLVLRYLAETTDDGLPGTEGTFIICSFWLVQALAIIGDLEAAQMLFDRILDVRNDVGLLSEEYDSINHRMLGNMPQAFSHVGLINAALALHDAGATRAGRT